MRLLKIGRDNSCDIVLNSSRVSSIHAELILLNNGDILLEDKNSTNGTTVMNQAVTPGKPVTVKRGDTIRFADVELVWNQVPTLEDNSGLKAIYGIGSNFRNDIVISGNTVSRFHATIKITKDGKAILQDHSKNGTTVNGKHIGNGQKINIKRGDSITCGGVPVSVDQYLPSRNFMKAVIAVAACVALVIGGYLVWPHISFGKIDPKTTQALENASVCVYGGYLYEITLKDDPLATNISGWPKKWYVGQNSNGEWVLSKSSEGMKAFEYTGTAFFISKDGDLGTNRHIAAPWEYIDNKLKEFIQQEMQLYRSLKALDKYPEMAMLIRLFNQAIESGQMDSNIIIAWLERFQKSEIEISGSHTYFGIGLTGTRIDNILDLQQCQVIAESGDVNKDVALIRLKSRKTPDYIVGMGAIYDIEQARLDESTLKPQEEEFTIVGYPKGELVGMSNGNELRPTMHKATLSKVPDDDKMQIQTVGIGGQSGSPVFDKKHRLVGVLFGGLNGTEITYCTNIKHLKNLYDKNKVR